tara:strand:- start:76063 stop:76386 length:324 start_codon:yes stop_codon:yes gene_type:complete
MPIYEYQCGACGHQMDKLQKMSDAPLTDCPECGKSALTKLVSAPGFQLKGSGWYVTDFRDKNKPEINTTEPPKSDAVTDVKSEAKTDVKADVKTETKTTTKAKDKDD